MPGQPWTAAAAAAAASAPLTACGDCWLAEPERKFKDFIDFRSSFSIMKMQK